MTSGLIAILSVFTISRARNRFFSTPSPLVGFFSGIRLCTNEQTILFMNCGKRYTRKYYFYKVTHFLLNPDTLSISFENSVIKISQRMSPPHYFHSANLKHLRMHLLNINNVHVEVDSATEQALNPTKNKLFDELSVLTYVLDA